jgi:hypothetical protein
LLWLQHSTQDSCAELFPELTNLRFSFDVDQDEEVGWLLASLTGVQALHLISPLNNAAVDLNTANLWL